MTFSEGDDVYIAPIKDTGEVAKCHHEIAEHDVLCDDLASVNRFPESDLRRLPHTARIRDGSFLIIIRARRKYFGEGRLLEINHHIVLSDGTVSSRKYREFRARK